MKSREKPNLKEPVCSVSSPAELLKTLDAGAMAVSYEPPPFAGDVRDAFVAGYENKCILILHEVTFADAISMTQKKALALQEMDVLAELMSHTGVQNNTIERWRRAMLYIIDRYEAVIKHFDRYSRAGYAAITQGLRYDPFVQKWHLDNQSHQYQSGREKLRVVLTLQGKTTEYAYDKSGVGASTLPDGSTCVHLCGSRGAWHRAPRDTNPMRLTVSFWLRPM